MIGVFDSGHGGLTVLAALKRHLPDRSFVYLGDHANVPYGEKSDETILALTIAGVDRLFGLGCRLVILACNTAAAAALRPLQQGWLADAHPHKRVLGVLVPMVEAITGVPWMADLAASRHAGCARTIGVFATRRTVASNAYPAEIGKRAPEVTVVQQACPHLAGLIEDGAESAILQPLVNRYVSSMMSKAEGRSLDAVMLGCTHYPLVAPLFRNALPAEIEILSQPELTARSLIAYLGNHPELDAAGNGQVRHFTSGDPQRVSAIASRFLSERLEFEPLYDQGKGCPSASSTRATAGRAATLRA